jgi:protein associated with RNAse G/E
MGHDVRVVYTKYDGSLHWHHTMRYLGCDAHGVWLGAPAGTSSQRGSEPPVILEQPWVQLIPAGDQWWSGAFNGEPAGTEIYCDIGTPARWVNSAEVTMVDLDLDVVRLRADRRVLLLDEDEFAEHQIRYGYPAEVIRQAEQAAAELLAAVSAGAQPFSTDYLSWLEMITLTDAAEAGAGPAAEP